MLQRCQLLLVFLRIEVARLDGLLEEVLPVLLVICIEENAIEVLVELAGLVLHEELEAVHELAFLATLLALAFQLTVEILTAEGLLGLGVERLDDLARVLWIDPQCVESNSESVLLPLFYGNVIVIEEEVIELEEWALHHVGIGDLGEDHRAHDDLVGVFEHHLVRHSLHLDFLSHLLNDCVLECEPHDVCTRPRLNDVPLRCDIDLDGANSDDVTLLQRPIFQLRYRYKPHLVGRVFDPHLQIVLILLEYLQDLDK